tara:strand:+ start:79 stop:447 length:369 start_codon:yes stop_codon:yes gene_type:complete
MKKILTLFFVFFAFESIAIEKKTTFDFDIFKEAQMTGKTVVVNSWNKFCGTCAQQTKIINEAKKEFPNVIFLSYEQKHKDIANFLKIDYWATIAVYKNNKKIKQEIGITTKQDIYSLINQGV